MSRKKTLKNDVVYLPLRKRFYCVPIFPPNDVRMTFMLVDWLQNEFILQPGLRFYFVTKPLDAFLEILHFYRLLSTYYLPKQNINRLKLLCYLEFDSIEDQ